MKIQHVDPAYIHVIWEQIAPFFKLVLDKSEVDEYTLDQVKVRITDGVWQVLVAVDETNAIAGAATLHFFNRPDARVGYISLMGGRLISNADTFEQLKKFMAINGATKIEGSARESVARLLTRYGFKEKYRVVGVSI
jgi:hypothetical protein